MNTASLALAFGSTGIAVQRDRALKKSEKELAKVQGEVQQLRSAFVGILAELEADVDASSARLEELQAAPAHSLHAVGDQAPQHVWARLMRGLSTFVARVPGVGVADDRFATAASRYLRASAHRSAAAACHGANWVLASGGH